MEEFYVSISILDHMGQTMYICSGLTLQQILFSHNFKWPVNRFNFIVPRKYNFSEFKNIIIRFKQMDMIYNNYKPPMENPSKFLTPIPFLMGVHEILLHL